MGYYVEKAEFAEQARSGTGNRVTASAEAHTAVLLSIAELVAVSVCCTVLSIVYLWACLRQCTLAKIGSLSCLGSRFMGPNKGCWLAPNKYEH